MFFSTHLYIPETWLNCPFRLNSKNKYTRGLFFFFFKLAPHSSAREFRVNPLTLSTSSIQIIPTNVRLINTPSTEKNQKFDQKPM